MVKKSVAVSPGGDARALALRSIDDKFGVGESVKHLQSIMHRVTEKEVTADSVNAACNCVATINNTVRTAIAAAKFLAEH